MSVDTGLVGAIGIVVTVIIAWFTMRQASADSKNRSRPYITVKIVEDMRTSKAFFIVENFGQSAAYNVHIEFDDALSRADPAPSDYGAYIRKMYASPGLTFGPGQSRRSIYKVMPETTSKHEVVAPDKLKGILRYYGPDRRRQYAEWVVLDMTGLYYRMDVTGSSTDIERRLKVISDKIGYLDMSVRETIGGLNAVRGSLESLAHQEDGSGREQ